MPDEKSGRDAQEQNPTSQGAGATEPETGRIEDLPAWAQRLIRETRDEAAERRIALKREQEEAAKREQARLAEEGRWKELAETRAAELAKLMPYQERATTLEKIISESNARRIGQIPEVMRTLVPSLPPEQQAAWLDQNWSLLTQRQAPNLDAGAGGSGRTVTLTDEQRQTAKRAGMTEEQFIAALKKAGRQP